MVDITRIARIGGLSASILSLVSLLGLIVAGFYMATAKSTSVMDQSRKCYYTFFAFLVVAVFLAGTTTGYSAYGPARF